MKKTKIFLIFVLSLIAFTTTTYAVDYGPTAVSSTDYATCYTFADVFKTITLNEGSYYYKYCYRATCSNGKYNLANMVQHFGYTCQNGNTAPYTMFTSDGCYYYNGSCGTTNSTYCTRVLYIDCNRTVSNKPFTTTTTTRSTTTRSTTSTSKWTTTLTTRKSTTTTTRTTTGKSTTKTTTKKTTTTTKGTTTTKKTTTTTRRESSTTTKNTTTRSTTGVIITPTTEPSTKSTTTITLPTSRARKSTDIKSITISNREINATNNKDQYNVKLPEGINSVEVEVELEMASSTYTVRGNENIPDDIPDEGVDIVINIAGTDGAQREIIINVVRSGKESSDCRLASIYVDKYFDDFSKNITEYEINLPDSITSLNPDIITSDDKAKFEIKGDEKLKNNSKIKIIVTAENGDTCTYTLKIKKSSNTWKYVLIIILLVIILAVAGILLMKYMKKSKGTYKYE